MVLVYLANLRTIPFVNLVGKKVNDRHANCHSILNLIENNRALRVGYFGCDFNASVDWTWVQNRELIVDGIQELFGQSILKAVLSDRKSVV